MDFNWCMNRFRLASRDLFNQYFTVPYSPAKYDYEFYELFDAVEKVLFETLVLEPCGVPFEEAYNYGDGNFLAHSSIIVRLPNSNTVENSIFGLALAPIFINREEFSADWDLPPNQFSNEATLHFISYFDWERMHCRDNYYVRVRIDEWPAHPDVVGKQALVEAHYVQFELRDPI